MVLLYDVAVRCRVLLRSDVDVLDIIYPSAVKGRFHAMPSLIAYCSSAAVKDRFHHLRHDKCHLDVKISVQNII